MRANHQENEVILISSAQSQWDRDNRFTGWADPALTLEGIAQAHAVGRRLQEMGYGFDHAYSSYLQRAMHTLDILLRELGQEGLKRERDWRLNERHYGALQGQNKEHVAQQVGTRQVDRWRRGFLDLPPPLALTDPRHPIHDPAHIDIPPGQLPRFESLDLNRRRVMAFWEERVRPRLQKGERLLISSHGNTLRALIMALSGMKVAEVESFEVPVATPIVYRFDAMGNPLDWHYLDSTGSCIGCAA